MSVAFFQPNELRNLITLDGEDPPTDEELAEAISQAVAFGGLVQGSTREALITPDHTDEGVCHYCTLMTHLVSDINVW